MCTPYHPAVYHLDLCIMAYHLHSQTLKWPFDPYYELIPKEIRWKIKDSFRNTNPHKYINRWLDPIEENDYSKIDPNNISFVRNWADEWVLYRTPPQIAESIKEISVIDLNRKIRVIKENDSGTNSLICFEGTTGGISSTEPGQKSILGFVLKRPIQKNDIREDEDDEMGKNKAKDYTNRFDIHIVFRGSRSGKLDTGLVDHFKSGMGNPDWVTDLNVQTDYQFSSEELTGNTAYGFSKSVEDTLPSILTCLNNLISEDEIIYLNNIYISGHSLGGALASLLGCAFCTKEKIDNLIDQLVLNEHLKSVKWKKKLRIYTYGAPPFCDKLFQDNFLRNGCKFFERYYCKGDMIANCEENKENFIGFLMKWYNDLQNNFHCVRGIKLKFNEGQHPMKKYLKLDAHMPSVIRKYLLLDLVEHKTKKEEFSLIPCNKGYDTNKPRSLEEGFWLETDNFTSISMLLLNNKSLNFSYKDRLGSFKECKENVKEYLTHLHGILIDNDDIKICSKFIEAIDSNFGFGNSAGEVVTAKGILKHYDSFSNKLDLWLPQLLRICTLMLVISQSETLQDLEEIRQANPYLFI